MPGKDDKSVRIVRQSGIIAAENFSLAAGKSNDLSGFYAAFFFRSENSLFFCRRKQKLRYRVPGYLRRAGSPNRRSDFKIRRTNQLCCISGIFRKDGKLLPVVPAAAPLGSIILINGCPARKNVGNYFFINTGLMRHFCSCTANGLNFRFRHECAVL